MSKMWRGFERIVRNAARFTDAPPTVEAQHPFEVRNIHSALPGEVKRLFDNAHYPQATFEAFKFLDNEVKRHSGVDKTGKALMMDVFRDVSPLVQLTPLTTDSERNEQEGYKFIFAGSMMAIRNPRGHEHSVRDDIDTCLDHLTLVSQLLRRLAQAGYHPLST